MITEAARSGIGKLFYKKIQNQQKLITTYLAKAMEDGKLRKDDPAIATLQLRALLEAQISEPCLLCAIDIPPKKSTIVQACNRAVACFLRAYAP